MSKEIKKNQELEDEVETSCYDCQNLFHSIDGKLYCSARSLNISILKEPVKHCDWYKKEDQAVTCTNCKQLDTEKVTDTLGNEIVRIVVEKLVKQGLLAPVIRGQWLEDYYGDSYCSVCKAYSFISHRNRKYCPNCGAKMDEEK